MEFSPTSVQGRQARGHTAASPRDLWAVVPVKALAGAKQRLRDCMGPCREDFTLAMFTDVLAALADSTAITGIAVVTSDPRVADIAAGGGLLVVEEGQSTGLNAAIDLGIQAVRRLGGHNAVILPSDIPLVTGAELDRLIAAFNMQAVDAFDNAIGIGASTDGGGTNCLILGIRRPFTFQYGPGSFNIHRESAKAHQRDVFLLYSSTIALDIDEPRHVDELLAFYKQHPEFRKSATWKFLHDTIPFAQQV